MTQFVTFDDRSHKAIKTTIDNQGNISVTKQSRFKYEQQSIQNQRNSQRTWENNVSNLCPTQKSNILQFHCKTKPFQGGIS